MAKLVLLSYSELIESADVVEIPDGWTFSDLASFVLPKTPEERDEFWSWLTRSTAWENDRYRLAYPLAYQDLNDLLVTCCLWASVRGKFQELGLRGLLNCEVWKPYTPLSTLVGLPGASYWNWDPESLAQAKELVRFLAERSGSSLAQEGDSVP